MSHQNTHLDTLQTKKFYQRMIAARDLPGVDVTTLETAVKLVCDNVAAVTTRVSDYFHAYTLHDMTHLWNVIDIMEELIPDDVWDQPWQNASDPDLRRPEEVPPLEIKNAIVDVLKRNVSMPVDDLARVVSKWFGHENDTQMHQRVHKIAAVCAGRGLCQLDGETIRAAA